MVSDRNAIFVNEADNRELTTVRDRRNVRVAFTGVDS